MSLNMLIILSFERRYDSEMADKVPEPFEQELDEKELLKIDKALSERLIKLNIIAQADLLGEDGARVKCDSALTIRYLNG